MKRCNRCGKIVEDDANYCPYCGQSYFSSYDTDQGEEAHEKENPEGGKQYGKTVPKRRNAQIIMIGTLAAAAAVFLIVVLAFLFTAGKFGLPVGGNSSDFDIPEEADQLVITDETDSSAEGTEVSDESSEKQPLTVIEVEIPEDGVEVTDENRDEVALSRLMSVDSDEFQYLEVNAFEDGWSAGVRCIDELVDDNIRMYCYYDDEVWFSGVAFDIKGEICYFDWCYASVNYYPVSMYWNEEDQQLQVICIPNHGTGFYAPDLYIVYKNDNGEWVSSHYGYEEYSEALQQRISYMLDKESFSVTLYDKETGSRIVSYQISELNMPYFEDIAWGDFSDFELGKEIVYTMSPGYVYYGTNIYPEAGSIQFELLLTIEDDGEIVFELGQIVVVEADGTVTVIEQSLQSVEYEIQKIDSSVYDGDRLLFEVSYDLVVLTGTQDVVEKINSSLYEEYEAFLAGDGNAEMVNSYAENLRNSTSTYQDSYFSMIGAFVSYNADGLLGISYTGEWYAGGVFNYYSYGQIFDLATGELVEFKDLSGMDEETFLTTLKKILLNYIAAQSDGTFYENAADTVRNYTLENFTLDLQDGEIVIIVNEYELGPLSSGMMVVPTGIAISR